MEIREPNNADHVIGHLDFGEQLRLWQACTYVQTCQSLSCSHTQRMEVDEDSDHNFDL